MRVLGVSKESQIKEIMRQIKADPYGIKIMLPKAVSYLVRINSLPCIAANILKQEALSLGADAALAREALTGRIKKSDCLLMATLAQLARLSEKLKKQPFGLDRLAGDLFATLDNYRRDRFRLKAARHRLDLSPAKTCIMGVVNLTPDSFSADGLYGRCSIDEAVSYAEKMAEDGADIIDIGGESSRPGAKPVPVKEELARTIPVIKKFCRRIKVPVSIDTCKPKVAEAALDNGAAIVNDISGLRDRAMARVVSRHKAAVVIMHMRGSPRTMQRRPKYNSLIDEVIGYLAGALKRAEDCGIDREKTVIDPGIGFGKTAEHNLEILNNLSDFKALGRPIMVGTSRKSFIGRILNAGPQERLFGTVSSCVLAAARGASIVRTHDVRQVKQALEVAQAVLNS